MPAELEVDEKRVEVGSLVIAKRDTGVCRFGEPGVCYEAYQLGDRSGWSFIFEDGRYDGFAPDEVAMMLHVTGQRSEDIAGYRFSDVGRLREDFQQGRFAGAFAQCHRTEGGRA